MLIVSSQIEHVTREVCQLTFFPFCWKETMNSKVKKEMYTPTPRHRSGHEGSREIKSCLTTPSGGFAKTPHNFFSVLITKKNFDFANGKNFSFFLASNCDSKI